MAYHHLVRVLCLNGLVALSLGLIGCGEKEDPNNPTLARVNNATIRQSDVDREIKAMVASHKQQLPEGAAEAMKEQFQGQALDSLVVRTLLLQDATKKKQIATDEEVTKAVKEFHESLPEDLTPEKALAELGLTVDGLEREIAENISLRHLMEDLTSGVAEIKAEEVQAFYDGNPAEFLKPEGVRARHLLIGVEAGDDDKTKASKRAKIEGYRRQLIKSKGKNFAEMAKKHSTGPSAESGGDLGEFGRGQMVPPFEKAAFSQKVGEIGGIVETQFGYHLILVEEKMPQKKAPFEEVKEAIAQYLQNDAQKKAFTEYVDSLKAEASIDIINKEEKEPNK